MKNEIFDILAQVVCKVNCGDKSGTAFLVNEKLALTAYHVVNGRDAIVLSLNAGNGEIEAILHEDVCEKYKRLDVALLKLAHNVEIEQYLEIMEQKISVGDKWVTRGYPSAKNSTGDNLYTDDNRIIQVLTTLQKGKINVQLDLDRKFATYEGLSGAPLIVDGKIVGIINTELKESYHSKELNGLTVQYFKGLLEAGGLSVMEGGALREDDRLDHFGCEKWEETKPSDVRNFSDKITAVCNGITKRRIGNYCKLIANGKAELSRYSEHDIRAMKYRIFEGCQDDLLDFVEKECKEQLSIDEVSDLIELYTQKAEQIIKDRSQDHSYPLYNNDILKKIVLDLIDECYLSFDEEGLYE